MSKAFVIAEVAGQRIAFAADQIDQVIEIDRLVQVPGALPVVAGITTLRSKILTVIDVARAVGAADSASCSKLALTADREGCGYAFLIDGVQAVVEVHGDVEPIQIRLHADWQRCSIGTVETPGGRALVGDLDLIIKGHGEVAAKPKKRVANL